MNSGNNIEAIEGLLISYKEVLKGLSWVPDTVKGAIDLADSKPRHKHNLQVHTDPIPLLYDGGVAAAHGECAISFTSAADEENGNWRRQRLVVALSEQGFYIARIVIGVGTPGILRADWQNRTFTRAKSDILSVPCLEFQKRDDVLRYYSLGGDFEEGINYAGQFLAKLQNPDQAHF